MKAFRIIMLSLMLISLLLAGCPSRWLDQDDIDMRWEAARVKQDVNIRDVMLCNEDGSKFWDFDTQRCVQRASVTGCRTLERFDSIEVTSLPKGYEQYKETFRTYDTGFCCPFYDIGNLSFRAWCKAAINEDASPCTEIGYSEIRNRGNEPITLCWEEK
jgi:hypothetical protein